MSRCDKGWWEKDMTLGTLNDESALLVAIFGGFGGFGGFAL